MQRISPEGKVLAAPCCSGRGVVGARGGTHRRAGAVGRGGRQAWRRLCSEGAAIWRARPHRWAGPPCMLVGAVSVAIPSDLGEDWVQGPILFVRDRASASEECCREGWMVGSDLSRQRLPPECNGSNSLPRANRAWRPAPPRARHPTRHRARSARACRRFENQPPTGARTFCTLFACRAGLARPVPSVHPGEQGACLSRRAAVGSCR